MIIDYRRSAEKEINVLHSLRILRINEQPLRKAEWILPLLTKEKIRKRHKQTVERMYIKHIK